MKYLKIALLFALTGCQATMYGTAERFNELNVGMSKKQVVDIMGDPISVSADGDKKEEYLTYRKMKQVVAWGPTFYRVILRDGRVVRWGEEDELKAAAK